MGRLATTLAVILLTLGFAWITPRVATALELSLGDPPTIAIAGASAIAELAALRAMPLPVAEAIHRSAIRHAVPVALVEAVAWKESRFRQDAVSPRGALGVMQLTPATADTLGVDAGDMASNVDGGAAYLAKLLRRYSGDTRLALAAYKAGPGNVTRYGGVPPYRETQQYVDTIMARLAQGPAAA